MAEVEVTQNRQSFLEGGAILDIPLSYLEGYKHMLYFLRFVRLNLTDSYVKAIFKSFKKVYIYQILPCRIRKWSLSASICSLFYK